jgi:hypothetical protein
MNLVETEAEVTCKFCLKQIELKAKCEAAKRK